MTHPLSDGDVARLNQRFEDEAPEAILRWALEDSGMPRVAMASAFQADGVAVMHMATRIRPDLPILFLDTGFHFGQTLEFKRELTERLGLNVVDLRGDHTPESQAERFGERLYERHPDLCCRLNKVIPFSRALHGYDAWVTALRRDSAPTRAGTPIVERYDLEPGRPMVKVNPIAPWSRRQVWDYLEEQGLPRHPLYDLGYAQIGCAPCTRLVFPGEDERAGRWDGAQKVECGIHAHGPEHDHAAPASKA
jgi:phosphoadenosine phosphosulfate reductase